MFKSLGKAFKKLFTKKVDPNATKFSKPVIVHETKTPEKTSLGGWNGIMDYSQRIDYHKKLNKVNRRRYRNKLARISRNQQHKIAA